MASYVQTSFLIISDTHASPSLTKSTWQLPHVDVLLHCGDLSNVGGIDDYRHTISLLRSVPAELKLVIAGNHDKTLDEAFWSAHVKRSRARGVIVDEDAHREAKALWTSDDPKNVGIIYLEEGTHTFTLRSGARFTIFTSPYQPTFGNWAFMYDRSQDRFNKTPLLKRTTGAFSAPSPIPSGIDIVMTHGPAAHHLDRCEDGDVGCKQLWRALERVKPKLHCCGHIHEGYGAERVDWEDNGKHITRRLDLKRVQHDWTSFDMREVVTTDSRRAGKSTIMVNASILDERYRPNHEPILVKLQLPAAP